jgi:hypothetical protein
MERTIKWEVLPDIDDGFGSISYSYESESLRVVLNGARSLSLHFAGVVAVRSEAECPGLDPIPQPLPVLRKSVTFPLLEVQGSRWLQGYEPIYSGRSHFILVSFDTLLQVIARPQVIAAWQ